MQTNEYTALIRQDKDWWVGWVEEIPGVNCQERSREELVETLQITLRGALAMDGNILPTTPVSA